MYSILLYLAYLIYADLKTLTEREMSLFMYRGYHTGTKTLALQSEDVILVARIQQHIDRKSTGSNADCDLTWKLALVRTVCQAKGRIIRSSAAGLYGVCDCST